MMAHGGFNSHVPDASRCWPCFHALICHVFAHLLSKVPVQIVSQFFPTLLLNATVPISHRSFPAFLWTTAEVNRPI